VALVSISIIIALAVIYGYLNGVTGSASVVATMISSRALGPRRALVLAALAMAVGPLFLGLAVANTIGMELVNPNITSGQIVIAGLLGAVVWSSFTQWLKLPTSISQSLVGGLVGAVWAGYGWQAISQAGLNKAIAALFLSPILGLLAAFILVRFTYFLCASATPHVNRWFNRGQVLVSLLMAMSFGSNNSQSTMGVITLGLVATGFLQSFVVPQWVIYLSAGVLCLSTLIGGFRLIHTMGGKFYKIRPIHGFSAQMASGTVILGASLLGGPVSGSQVVTSAIVGAGSADRIQMIRWNVVQSILLGWILTIPLSGLVSALTYTLLRGATG
jgi:PiT family inorganic phosphate transporter